MALLTDVEWTIRQLRINYLRSDDGLAERLISFPPPPAAYVLPATGTGQQSQGLLPHPVGASAGMLSTSTSRSRSLVSLSASQPLTQPSGSQRPQQQQQQQLPQPQTYSYCLDPVPERALCYSPNLAYITSDLTPVGGGPTNGANNAMRSSGARQRPQAQAAPPPMLQVNDQQQQPQQSDKVAADDAQAQKSAEQLSVTATVEEIVTPTSQTRKFDREPTSGAPRRLASALSTILHAGSSRNNPFATDFSFICGKGELNPVQLRIYFPHSQLPRKPLSIVVKRDATVEDVIGYALYEYVEAKRLPAVDASSGTGKVVAWNLRIVEDDGTIDDDFPALERTRKVQKFSFDAFAICLANPKQAKTSTQVRQSAAPATQSSTPASTTTVKKQGGNYFIKVHLYSTLEVKQTTTVNLSGDMLLSEVLVVCCRKRKIDASDYTLKMADTKTDVPLDRTLESLGLEEICLLKKDRGPSAGDIFLRPPEEADQDNDYEQPVYRSDEYTSVYKRYNVTRKMPKIMGRQERVLAIDGDYIYIMPSETKNLFDSVKTTSFHISSVLSCKQVKKSAPSFKMICQRDRDMKVYELDAATPQEAHEICSKIHFMSQFNKPVPAPKI